MIIIYQGRNNKLLKTICFCNLVGAGSLDGLLEVSLAVTTAGLCAGGLIPGGLVGRGGTAALLVNIIKLQHL